MDDLQVDLNWISPASGNKYVPAGLAAAMAKAEVEDPRSAVVAQASF